MQEESRVARKLSVLEDMGLERVNDASSVTESTFLGDNTHKVFCGRPAMGTLVSVTALGTSNDQVEDAIGSAFQEMDRLVALLSRYESSSAVSCLNSQGSLRDLHPEFSRLISRSLQFHDLSHGAFDISVEPIVDLFRDRLGSESPNEPSRSEIAEALELVGSRHIDLTSDGLGFKRSGMSVSLNGIAKGYIVDAIAGILEGGGVNDYLIDAGGDVRVAGTKEEGLPWTVAVQDPSKNNQFPDTIHTQLEFESGSIGSLDVSLVYQPLEYRDSGGPLVVCRHGSIRFLPYTTHIDLHWQHTGEPHPHLERFQDLGHDYAFRKELRDFARWVLYGTEPCLTWREGLRCVEALEAAQRSASEGGAVITLPLYPELER